MPGAPKTPPTGLNLSEFINGLCGYVYAATATGAVLSFATTQWPDIGGTMPNENNAFTTCVDPDSPPQNNSPCAYCLTALKIGGGAGYCPRVRSAYSTMRLSP